MRTGHPFGHLIGLTAAAVLALPAHAQLPAASIAAAADARSPRAVDVDASARPAPTREAAAAHVRAALDAMGGEAALRALKSVRIKGIEQIHMLEQSERFEGPWIPMYRQFEELRDHAHRRTRTTASLLLGQLEDWTPPRATIVADGVAAVRMGDRSGPAQPSEVRDARDRLALSPERVLLLALAAPDLWQDPDTVLHGVPQHVVAFGRDGGRVRILLNAYTALPTALETTRAYPEDYFWDVWGDVTLRTFYSYWTLEPGGIRYPRQADVTWNGFPYRTTTITGLTLHAEAPADSFHIPDEAGRAFEAMAARIRGPKTIELGEAWGGGRSMGEPELLADGVVVVPGGYFTLLVRQPDGVVIVEAPFSSEYTGRVLAEAERRFPGVPVKAVITTGDAWPYMGGVREYVARGIPVHALALNRPVLERLVRQPHTIDPDSLQRAPRPQRFAWVDGPATLGTGRNRLEIHPVRGEAGERMMAVYLPGHGILWSSDLIQRMPDGSFFMLQYVSEIVDLVRREGLDVETVVGMHLPPMPWDDAVAAVRARRDGHAAKGER